jgi:hypothetical protein
MRKKLKEIEKETAELLAEIGLTKQQQEQVMQVITRKLINEYHENIRGNNEQRGNSTKQN